jgi:hypothetical protein
MKNDNSTKQSNASKPMLCSGFLANYLPHDVIVERISYKHERFKTLTAYDLCPDGEIDNIRLILRPLSDLIDNILDDDNDENYQLSCELADLLNTTDSSYFVKALIKNTYYAIDHRLWTDIENWLNKNHFDWKYNLIEKGLAVSIHNIG